MAYVKRGPWIYAAYKGEEFLCEGTREEICAHLGIKLKTFQFYRTNIYKGKVTKGHCRRVIIRIDGKDKIWNEKEDEREEREEGI